MWSIKFIKLAKNRFNSEVDYRQFQQYQAQRLVANLEDEIRISDTVLDLGGSLGGYSIELSNISERVYILDLKPSKNSTNIANIFPIKGDACNIPLKDKSVNFVFCSSLIEHIPQQKKLLSEISRVLKDDGFCYLSFPPFYSPVGGHRYRPFHLLGERNAIILANYFKHLNENGYRSKLSGHYNLYPTTISKIKRRINESNFVIVKQATRFSPINFSKIPILCEFLTWHVEFHLKKKI